MINRAIIAAFTVTFLLASAITAKAQSTGLAEAHRQFDARHYAQAQTLFEAEGYNGNADAQLFLGNFHYYGMGDKVDKTKSAYWYGLAGENGFVSAMLLLGIMLENVDGIDRSFEMARHWYDKAAKAGSAQGQALLAKIDAKILHEQGNIKADGYYENQAQPAQAATFEAAQKTYVECDYAAAHKALLVVAQSGDIRAYNTLGDMYRLGQHVRKSNSRAVEYYLKGANYHKGAKKTGAKPGDPKALLNLSRMYEQGLGTPQDYDKAAKYYQLAVEGKNIRSACFLYGVAARSGDSCAKKQLARLDGVQAPKTSVAPTQLRATASVKPVPKIELGSPYSPKVLTKSVKKRSDWADDGITEDFNSRNYAKVRAEATYYGEHGKKPRLSKIMVFKSRSPRPRAGRTNIKRIGRPITVGNE